MLIGACGSIDCVGDCRECGMIELWDEDKIEFEPLNKAVTLEDEGSEEEESKKKISFWDVLGFWG